MLARIACSLAVSATLIAPPALAQDGAVEFLTLNADCELLHKSVQPLDTYFRTTLPRTSWQTGATLACDFEVLHGSKFPGPDGCTTPVNRLASGGKFSIDAGDGFVFKIETGFAVASGTAPLVAGRRVRAASDGTNFVVEVQRDISAGGNDVITERVYVLTPVPSHPVYVREYTDDAQTTLVDTYSIAHPGEFVEIQWIDGVRQTPVLNRNIGNASTPDVSYFWGQMTLLMVDPCRFAPEESATPLAYKTTSLTPDGSVITLERAVRQVGAQPQSLLSRFAARWPALLDKGELRLFVPAGTDVSRLLNGLGAVPRPPADPAGSDWLK